jgi:glycosyltransferase involved in cell wall biosynthesis
VADLRDLWSQDHNSTAPGWRRRIDRLIERRTFRNAAALVTVSPPLAQDLGSLHAAVPVHSILNGFDPEETAVDHRPDPVFTLTHTGTFYQGRRDPTLLFEAVANLIDRGDVPKDGIRIRLFARHEPWVGRLAERHGVAHAVELLPWGSRQRSLEAQRTAQVLLLLHWGGHKERGVYTGKIFEYLAARRPILMIGGADGVLSELIHETQAGVHVTDQPSLEQALLRFWREFEHQGEVRWRGRDDLVDRFSHRRMAEEYARLLDDVVDRG